MSARPDSVPDAFAVKTREGVTLYAEAARKTILAFWPYWRTNLPEFRQRYIHNVSGQSYRLRWLTL